MSKMTNVWKAGLAASLLAVNDLAVATGPTLGNLATNAASGNTAFRDMFLSFATLAGIVLVMLALFLFHQESKQPNQGNMKKGVFSLVIGIGLLSLDFIAGAGKNQLTGGQDAFGSDGNPFSGSINGNTFGTSP